MTDDRWVPPGEPTVGVAGSIPQSLLAVIEATSTAVEATSEAVAEADPDCVVVADEATAATVRESTAVPIVLASSIDADGLERLLTTGGTVQSHLRVLVELPTGAPIHAVGEVALIASEVGRLSEFGIATEREQVGRVRADGLVVATPLGTTGYARRLDAPRLAPETDSVAVVPIAPFGLEHPSWVCSADRVTVTVERDEEQVDLRVDGLDRGRVGLHDEVTIERDGSVDLLV